MPEANFEGYAIVEIMGHQRVAGYVTTEAFGSVVMFKVVQTELPPTEQVLSGNQYVDGEYCPAGSKVRISRERAETYVGAASIYRMTPCTEGEALKAQPCKIEVIEKAQRQLPAVVDAAIAFGDEGYGDDPDADPDDDDEDAFASDNTGALPPVEEPISIPVCAACVALGPGKFCPECIPF